MSQFIEMFGDPNKGLWTASVADYCHILGGFAFKSDLFSNYGVPIVRISNINEGEVDINQCVNYAYDFWASNPSYRVLNGDILMAMSGATTGKVGVFKQNVPALLNQRVACVRQKEGRSISSFLYAAFQSEYMYKVIQSTAQGGAQPNISSKQISQLPMPAANILDQKKFETISQQADKSKFVGFKSQFIEMFKDSPLVRLGDHIETQSGGTPNTKKSEYYDEGTIPWLSSGEVNQGYISSTEKYITEDGLANSAAKWVPKNSVVIAMYGATAGKVGFITIPLTTNQAVCALLPNDAFNPLYLYYAISSKKDWMMAQCRGAAQPNISQGIIRSMEIPMPSLDEQMQFANIVKQADKSKYIS